MVTQRPRVIIIENDWNFGLELADWLAVQGYQPVVVRSAEVAMEDVGMVSPCALIVALDSAAVHAQTDAVFRLMQTVPSTLPVILIGEQDLPIPPILREAARRRLARPVRCAEIGEVLRGALSQQAAVPMA